MRSIINKLKTAVAKLEKAAVPDVVYTLPDGEIYPMDANEAIRAIAAALYDCQISEQSEVLLDAVECSADSKIHTLFQMVQDGAVAAPRPVGDETRQR